jgi:DNA-binding GntR family transcriptional regulator
LDNYKPLRELVFDSLREAILLGRLKPGERLMEVQLADEMGVSRTPVREAIRKLELDGFVVMIPRKGAYVASITLKDIADVFEVRAALEGMAAGLAAERITEDEMEQLERSLLKEARLDSEGISNFVDNDTLFHEMIYSASRNKQLQHIITHLREQIQRFRTTSLSQPGRTRESLDEHKKIVEAITSRDVDSARNLAREHIENAEQSLLNAVRKEEIGND